MTTAPFPEDLLYHSAVTAVVLLFRPLRIPFPEATASVQRWMEGAEQSVREDGTLRQSIVFVPNSYG